MRAFVVFSFALLGACYRYVPLPATMPEPVAGTEVRSFLTPDGASSMATTLGRNVTVFDGRVLAGEASAWRIAVSRTQTAEDRIVSWTGEPVNVPRTSIARMELRVLDRPKTIRTALLGTAGAILVGLMVKGIAGAASGDPGGGGVINP